METEFALVALDHDGERADPMAVEAMLAYVRDHCTSLPGGRSRLFLPNGACIYQDGGHLEYCTPECLSPRELVRFARAGEIFVSRIAAEIEQQPRFAEIRLLKHCVDYIDTFSTWGCHESYNYVRSGRQLAPQLIPFLCSRVVLTGCGGLDPFSPGYEFQISPRVTHLRHVVSTNSTGERGIFHAKNEPLSRSPYDRLHIITGESLHSQHQTALKFGTLALVLAARDHGELPGNELMLHDPLRAIRQFSGDPACQSAAKLASGLWLTAVDIQRRYLELIERHLGSDVLPSWAESVCADWRSTLDSLEEDPQSLRKKLDWPLKHAVFAERIDRDPVIDKASIPAWNQFAAGLAAWRDHGATPESREPIPELSLATIRRHQRERGARARKLRSLLGALNRADVPLEQFDDFRKLRYDLAALDVRFGDLKDGIFVSLDSAGLLDHAMVDEPSCERAQREPPAAGRARIRGEVVSRLWRQQGDTPTFFCDWTAIEGDRRRLDLDDPFTDTEVWKSTAAAELPPIVESDSLRHDLLAHLRARRRSTNESAEN